MNCSSEIRQRIRTARQSLSPHAVKQKSRSICKQLVRSPEYRSSSRIALYLSNDNEPQPELIFPRAWTTNRQFYLPIIKPKPFSGLWFGRYNKKSELQLNRYNIAEPTLVQRGLIPAWAINVAFVPLVAFDLKGNRLGMGGGFYDRTFAYLNRRSTLKKPLLIGIAFECQKVDRLPQQSWDIPLNGVITEKNFYRF